MDSSDYKKIWTPLYLIKNLVDLHDYELENRETMIYGMKHLPDEKELAGFRIKYFRATVFCGMHFEKFPFDHQTCQFEVSFMEKHSFFVKGFFVKFLAYELFSSKFQCRK